jgi:sterol desaturase/sphingolipid hydroxylase (fatty acid hydroxylase superfamily)
VTKLVYLLPTSAAATVLTGTAIHRALAAILPSPVPTPVGPVMVIVFTITMLLAYDLSYYIYHYLQHKVPVLWELHKVHHSAELMVGITEGRVHPLDDLMTHIWDGIIPGIAYGIWLFFLLDPVEVTIFGINVYVMRNIVMMDFVRHTHFKLSFGRWINAIILCPHWHQLHHSSAPQHWDKNFGLMLSIWDRMFGTLVVPQPNEDFKFGLAHEEHLDYRSLLRLYLVPLNKICNILLPITRPKHPE